MEPQIVTDFCKMRIQTYKMIQFVSYIFFIVVAISIILLIATTIKYGDPKTITTDPNHPRIEDGSMNYMDKYTYRKYDYKISKIHYTGLCFFMFGILLYGFACLIRKAEKSKNKKLD
jgi:hypothetical protein